MSAWAEGQKEALYDGRAADIVDEIDKCLARFEPGQPSARARLQKVRTYIAKRVDKMNYKQLRARDLGDLFGGS